jgi:hypothetical protein
MHLRHFSPFYRPSYTGWLVLSTLGFSYRISKGFGPTRAVFHGPYHHVITARATATAEFMLYFCFVLF